MTEVVEKRKEESNSSITEENLQKAMEFVRQNPEKIKAISVNDLLKQQRDLYCIEGKKEDSFLFELLVLLGAESDDDTFYYAIDLGMLGLVKLLVERYNFDVNRGNHYIPILTAINASSATCTEDEKAEVVKFLTSKGADIHVNDNQALEIAANKKMYKVLRVLLEADESI